jgi:hypothetical protein
MALRATTDMRFYLHLTDQAAIPDAPDLDRKTRANGPPTFASLATSKVANL